MRRFLIVEFRTAHGDTHLPNTGPVAAFTFRGSCRLDGQQLAPDAALTGLREKSRSHFHLAGHAVALAEFEASGAAAFVRPPLEEFAGVTTDLAGILAPTRDLDRLLDRLDAAPNHSRRVAQLEAFFLARLRTAAADPLVEAAVKWIRSGNGNGRIEELTRHIGLSQSALERRFRRSIGITPKRYASLLRFRHSIALLSFGADLTTVANSAGYFDQSHFVREFRNATGFSPTAFLRANP
ncbi:MAG TPA: helix-turn-helix transcriptional regulator [Candidatus Didemnitutus sp.]|nr:helix-turn-helix transcriptional regulator [Candidatus Didemnitutus sp.]